MTIFAPATPLGGAIAIIRISGQNTLSVLSGAFTGKAAHGRITHGQIKSDGAVLDDCMASYFHAPHSYTGEDMAELYLHGSAAVVSSVCELLEKLGARPAMPGEFTKRAFLNGKLDLSEASAVMDLISSSTRRSANAALMQLTGRLSEEINALEERILTLLTAIDAAIDYPDEMEDDVTAALPGDIRALTEKLSALIENGMRSQALRNGITVAIVGQPNVGKSSLLNALLCVDRAIVTSVAGTTRDIIEEQTDFYGVPVRLFDTAGLRDASDEVEKLGVERTNALIERSDLLVLAFDGSTSLNAYDRELLEKTANARRIIAICKNDIADKISAELSAYDPVSISSRTGDGLDTLKKRIAYTFCPPGDAIITDMRHISLLRDALSAVSSAQCAAELDMVATDLHEALLALSGITGREVDSRIVDEIFSRFCVGK